MIKKTLAMLAILIATASIASAQTPSNPASKLAWDEGGPSAATVQGYTYNLYVDGSSTPIPLSGVSCQDLSHPDGFTCEAPFPAFTQGLHILTLSASSGGFETLKSDPLSITFIILQTPKGLTVIR